MTEVEELFDLDFNDPDMPGDDLVDTACSGVAGLGRSVTGFIVEHPEICLALALAVGAAVGLVVKRR